MTSYPVLLVRMGNKVCLPALQNNFLENPKSRNQNADARKVLSRDRVTIDEFLDW
jgi:hypothetical protein